jgi:uncharacterized BrkB/YihY/UPF0761 family membrane protein
MLLVWMYIISAIVLVGAEFNALLFPRIITTQSPRAASMPQTRAGVG